MNTKKFDMRLSYWQGKFRAIYDPKTAFGNEALIAIMRQIEAIVAEKERWENGEKEWCSTCGGTGRVECDCEDCEGTGEIVVQERGEPQFIV